MNSRWSAILGLGSLFCGGLLGCSSGDARGAWSGTLDGDVTWSGAITITGDLIVLPGATLTILPGTVITVRADEDDQHASHLGPPDALTRGDPTHDPDAGGVAFQQAHVSILIQGRIDARGRADAPIVWKSSKATPFYTDWDGIQVAEGAFAYNVVEWCLNGLYAAQNHKGMTVDHSVVRHIWAAGVGFHQPAASSGPSWVKNSRIEDCGHEAVDTHSPGNLELAYNVVSRSQVGFNLQDAMTANVHHNVITRTGFPVLAVNATSVLVTHGTLQAEIPDSSRWTYGGYTMPRLTNAAGVFAQGSARAIVTNSIFFESPMGLRSEAGASALENGYLNMDGVTTGYGIEATAGAGCLAVDSGFVDRGGGDYHLKASSPLRGKGNPANGSPDLGAYGGADAQQELGWSYP